MKKLNLDIPQFKLYRYVRIQHNEKENILQNKLNIKGIDSKGRPYTIFKKVEVK